MPMINKQKNAVIIFAMLMMFLGMGAGIWIVLSGNVWGLAVSFIAVIMIGSWLIVASGEDDEERD
jgi:hypothetical protein